MNTAHLSAAGVREEIWRSLVSMLRVYASAATLGRNPCTINEVSPQIVRLASTGAELRLCFEPRTGEGRWRLRKKAGEESQGTFQMAEDGTLQLAGMEKQLDHAAVEWIEDLTRGATLERVS